MNALPIYIHLWLFSLHNRELIVKCDFGQSNEKFQEHLIQRIWSKFGEILIMVEIYARILALPDRGKIPRGKVKKFFAW